MRIVVCHCGVSFEDREYRRGAKRKHCSGRCSFIAHQCRKRGITTDEYWRLFKEGCPICRKEHSRTGRRPHLDHDHVTGKVRSMLCHLCNMGKVGTNTLETARRVVLYLETH